MDILDKVYQQDSLKNQVDKVLLDIDEAMKNPGQLPGMTTSIKSLDEIIDGFMKKCIYVVAAATGMGKTTLATNMASHAALKHSVGFLSLEQPASQLVARMLSDITGKTLKQMRRGLLTPEEREQMQILADQLSDRRLVIRDTFDRTFKNLKKNILQMYDLYEIEILFVDYLQLMQGDDHRSTEAEISEVVRNLNALKIELDIPIVVLAQVNRGVEQNEGFRPQLGNLRGSGSIEHTADVVLFIFREEYYFNQKPEPSITDYSARADYEAEKVRVRGKAEIIVRKNRHGENNVTIPVKFDADRMLFTDTDDGGFRS